MYKKKPQQLIHCGILLKLKDEILKKQKKKKGTQAIMLSGS